jgi:hypothetical protein
MMGQPFEHRWLRSPCRWRSRWKPLTAAPQSVGRQADSKPHIDNSKKRAAAHPLSGPLSSPLGLAGGSRLRAVVGVGVGVGRVVSVNVSHVNVGGVGRGGVVGFGG